MLTAREALREYLERRGIGRGAGPDEWYADPWFRARLGERRVPIWPVMGFRRGLVAHDLHHVITGYETDWAGELRVAAWELGSGGCGRDLLFWIDRILFLLIGFPFAPRATWRALQRGRRCANLYGARTADLLATGYEALRRRVLRLDPANLTDGLEITLD